jgi:tRNA dimethylallyltransferase
MAPRIVIICGPTATGKTRLGAALAKALNGEVVSADSMQVYRDMAVGTARPSQEEMEGVPHHMLAVAEPEEDYSVARYVAEAVPVVDDILARGKLPFIVGGTGLYIDALRRGRTFSARSTDSGLREKLRARAEAEGLPALYKELEAADPEGAARLHPNDAKRILRALEVWYETGETISAHDRRTRDLPPRYDAAVLALTFRDRAALYARIDRRVDGMMARGLPEEVRALLDRGVPPDCTAMQAIGYKELAPAVLAGGDLTAAAEEIKLRSRQYAKRQLTWFRRDPAAHWLLLDDPPDFSALLRDSTEYLRQVGLP